MNDAELTFYTFHFAEDGEMPVIAVQLVPPPQLGVNEQDERATLDANFLGRGWETVRLSGTNWPQGEQAAVMFTRGGRLVISSHPHVVYDGPAAPSDDRDRAMLAERVVVLVSTRPLDRSDGVQAASDAGLLAGTWASVTRTTQ